MDIYVGIVAYQPEVEALHALIQSQSTYPIWLFLNSPLDAEEIIRLPTNVRILTTGENVGVGEAYNRIVAAARAFGARRLLLLDQDSTPPADIIPALERTFNALGEWQEQPAVVGALPVSESEKFKPPREFTDASHQRRDTARPSEFVISSGSLYDLGVLAKVGGFRADFFIDAIDIEWCFRAQSMGYSCWIDEAVKMPHRLGDGVIRLPLMDVRLTKQAPSRLYTYVRNQIAMLRMDHVPQRWKLRVLPYMMVQSAIYTAASRGTRGRVMRALASGWSDGIRQRMGPGRRDRF